MRKAVHERTLIFHQRDHSRISESTCIEMSAERIFYDSDGWSGACIQSNKNYVINKTNPTIQPK